MVDYRTWSVLGERQSPVRSDITMSLAFSGRDALSCSIILRTYVIARIARALVLFMDKLSICF